MSAASANFRRSPDCEMIRISGDGTTCYQEVKMTTPQNELYKLVQTVSQLQDRVRRLSDMFEVDESGKDFFDTINQMKLEISNLMTSHERLENQMNLIIKLLSIQEKRKDIG